MKTQTTSAADQVKEYLNEYHDHNPAKYISIVSMILALSEKDHPEERNEITWLLYGLVNKFTQEQLVEAINIIEKTKEDVLTGKASYDGLSKEFLCEQYDTTIAFMRYHFIDD